MGWNIWTISITIHLPFEPSVTPGWVIIRENPRHCYDLEYAVAVWRERKLVTISYRDRLYVYRSIVEYRPIKPKTHFIHITGPGSLQR